VIGDTRTEQDFARFLDTLLSSAAANTRWDIATLQGHTDHVTSAVFSPEGGRILTASADNTARLWDRDGKPLATLQGHTGGVTSAVFAPDGGRILTASSAT
jgi:WD40 repeat protein